MMADQRRHVRPEYPKPEATKEEVISFLKDWLRYIGGVNIGDEYAERFPIHFEGNGATLYSYSKEQAGSIFENEHLGNTLHMQLQYNSPYGATRRLWAYSRFIYSFTTTVAILGGYIFPGAYRKALFFIPIILWFFASGFAGASMFSNENEPRIHEWVTYRPWGADEYSFSIIELVRNIREWCSAAPATT